MKIFLSYILLFFYTLTCTGSSVYMHLCSKGSFVLSQTGEQTAKSCPLCNKHKEDAGEQETAEHSCGEQSDCCKDVKIDLKKGDQEIENASSTVSFLTLSPTIATLHWIIAVPQETTDLSSPQAIDSSPPLVTTNPPYLIHCNFRI